MRGQHSHSVLDGTTPVTAPAKSGK